MGQPRIDAVAKLNSTPVEQHKQIAEDFAFAKLKTLEQKYPEMAQEDRFDHCDRSTARMWQQFQALQSLESAEMKAHVLDKTDAGKSKIAADFVAIQKLGEQFQRAETVADHVHIYSELVSHIVKPEPLVKQSALEMLAFLVSETPTELQVDFLSRPLTVAFGLHVDGLPTSHRHRHGVRELVKTHLQGNLGVLGELTNAMLAEDQRKQTADVLRAYREFLDKSVVR